MYFRVIDTDLEHPFYVTAADEALALSCSMKDGMDTLHFYRREPSGISVGYFEKVEDNVNIDECKKLGIKIVRRTSAGGSIYTDRNQLIYSLITRKPLGKNIEVTFELVCNCLIEALFELGIDATYKPPNDILINGKKVSGSAQVKKRNVYLIHGTMILALENNTLERVLKNHKPGYTSSIQAECGFMPEIDSLKIAIRNAFSAKFNIRYQVGDFTDSEKKIIQELVENKYSTQKWNFKR
ncbi:MAG: lipoate--protein ligase family protein [Promethearchaeota archaeon]